MNFKIIATEHFERKLKRLSKKYKSLANDLHIILDELADNPTFGKPLGKNCYKIRIAITSKSKGKSGGGRMITCVRVVRTQQIKNLRC